MRMSWVKSFKLNTAVVLLALLACSVHADDKNWIATGDNDSPCNFSSKEDLGSAAGIAAYMCSGWSACITDITDLKCSPKLVENPSGTITVTTVVTGKNSNNSNYGPAPWTGGSGDRLKSGSQKCEIKTHSPVVVSRGEKYYSFEDMRRGSSQFPIVIERTYRTHLFPDFKPHGNWEFTYLANRLLDFTSSDVRVNLPDGKVVGFALTSSSSSSNIYHTTDPGVYYELILNKTTSPHQWEFTRPDGFVEIYNASSTSTQKEGWLKKVINPTGLSHSFAYTYSGEADPTQIDITDDQSGQEIRWVLDKAGVPTELRDVISSTSSVWIRKYTWYDDGRLQKVTYSDSTTSVDTDNFAQEFLYDSANYNRGTGQTADDFKFLITGIKEWAGTTGTVYSNVIYDHLGRVTTSQLKNGSSTLETTTFAYPNWDWSSNVLKPQTEVTNANGLMTTYTFTTDKDNDGVNDGSSGHEGTLYTRNWQIESVVGEDYQSGGCAATSYNTTYDTDRFLVTTENHRGYVTKRTHNSQGRITVLEQTLSSSSGNPPLQESQKMETDWHSNTSLNLPLEKRYFGRHSGNTGWDKYRTVQFTYDDGSGSGSTHNCDGNSSLDTHRICSQKIIDELSTSSPKASRTWTYAYTLYSGTSVVHTQTIDGPLSGTGDTTTYTYDSESHITSIENALSQTTSYDDYNAFGFPETITDANGIETAVTYDPDNGRITQMVVDTGYTGINATTSYTYKLNGLLDVVTSPDGSTLQYFYNNAHELIGLENNHGDYIEYTPDVLNGQWKIQEICTAGNAVDGCTGDVVAKYERVFDALGRLSKIKDASGADRQIIGYDVNDNVTSKILKRNATNTPTYDNNDIASVSDYDAFDRLTQITGAFPCSGACSIGYYNNYGGSIPTSPAPPVTEYAYDMQGNINKVTDANGNHTDYTYNGFGELVTQVSPDTGTTTYEYNAAGLLSQKTDAKSIVMNYSYDNIGRLTSKYVGSAPTIACSQSNVSGQNVLYVYDQSSHGESIGRLTCAVDSSGLTEYSYNALGKVLTKSFDPVGSLGALVTAYEYNDAGALLKVTYPDDREVDYTRSNGHLTGMTLAYASSSLDVNNITYQAFGGINSFNRNTETSDYLNTTRTITADGLLDSITHTLSSGGSVGLEYAYDAFNNISHIENDLNPGISETFEYDAQQRLAKATGLYGRYTYGYDAVGNRLSAVLARNTPTTPSTFNEIFTEAYTYLSNTNKLDSVSRVHGSNTLRERVLDYDANGNRVKDRKTVYTSGTTTVESDHVMVPAYGNNNRMDSIDATDCVAHPSNTECQ